MIPGPFEYHQPGTVDEAVALLGQYGDAGQMIAGGHSLIPMMKLRLAVPEHLIDLRRVDGLAGIKEEGSGRQRTYRIRALNSPQILTPSQVDRLPAVLHDAHDIWIERARLDLEAWRQLELPILSDQDDVR